MHYSNLYNCIIAVQVFYAEKYFLSYNHFCLFFAVPISPEKQAQLRSMFQKRRSTPVRRSTLGESVGIGNSP